MVFWHARLCAPRKACPVRLRKDWMSDDGTKQHGPARRVLAGPSSGPSTSRPGRGRALGRARSITTWSASGRRPAGSFQADADHVVIDRVSEPESALPLANGKQGAGSAQRRPRCRASS